MDKLYELSLFPLVLTLLAFRLGQLCQQKWKNPLLNPILLGAGFVILFLLASGMDSELYSAGTAKISWLMTPATISLAIPMYEQFQILKKDFRAIAAGVIAGTVASLAVMLFGGLLFRLDRALILSLLPKSVTTAIGLALSQMQGGVGAVTTAAIILTGITANMIGPFVCRIFGIRSPVAQGVALGTAGHVIGTAKAGELSPLTGAVSSLSLVVAGLLTALLMPLAANFV